MKQKKSSVSCCGTLVCRKTSHNLLKERHAEKSFCQTDERSADDLVGRIEIPVAQLIENPNQISRRTDKLQGFQDADDMPGQLTWSVGYFSKVDLAS